jgi:1-aminocyclopropane-1-carboxylate deaminase/D-cysteine desulfhydrase-like pyridoxal-dependent ACC family enzyme
MVQGLTFDEITVDDISFLYRPVEVSVLRLDKISPIVSGNKWFKLRFYLEEAIQLKKKGIMTFGGAWSNHIVATATICNMYGLKSIGIIRGEEPAELSLTLQQAKQEQMQLYFISRSDYRAQKNPETISIDDYLKVTEGGYGQPGMAGASTILDYGPIGFTHCICSVGTGTMLAGIIDRISPQQCAIGISAIKNTAHLVENVKSLVGDHKINWQIMEDFSFGGYAKHNAELIRFMNDFYRNTNIPSDFVYTGKLFYAVSVLIEQNYFPQGSKLLVIHSGGLQGNRSLKTATLIF